VIVEDGFVGNLRLRSEESLDVMTSDILERQIIIQEIRKLLERIEVVADGMFAEMARTGSE